MPDKIHFHEVHGPLWKGGFVYGAKWSIEFGGLTSKGSKELCSSDRFGEAGFLECYANLDHTWKHIRIPLDKKALGDILKAAMLAAQTVVAQGDS